jgi:AraC-like DNA-binding protein
VSALPLPSVAVYAGAATIGRFRCDPRHPQFRDSGPARNQLLVFPREPVVIRHVDRAAVVADPTVAMIYNRGQRYTRSALVAAGDRCDWFAFAASDVAEARGVDDLDRPFGELVRASCEPATYLLARRAFEHASGPAPDRTRLDEACAAILDAVLRAAVGAPRREPTRAHVELAEATRSLLGRRFAEAWSLAEIAAELGVSAFHVARVFRAVTGRTIHRHRTELRVRAALERIADGVPLVQVALDLGFSSHSHFTHAFGLVFGRVPRALRARS